MSGVTNCLQVSSHIPNRPTSSCLGLSFICSSLVRVGGYSIVAISGARQNFESRSTISYSGKFASFLNSIDTLLRRDVCQHLYSLIIKSCVHHAPCDDIRMLFYSNFLLSSIATILETCTMLYIFNRERNTLINNYIDMTRVIFVDKKDK